MALMPRSNARLMMARLASSCSTQERQAGSPKPIAPSVRRETFRPQRPRLTWSKRAIERRKTSSPRRRGPMSFEKKTGSPPSRGRRGAAFLLGLPHVGEARNLIRDPLEVVHRVAQRGVLHREEEWHHRGILH